MNHDIKKPALEDGPFALAAKRAKAVVDGDKPNWRTGLFDGLYPDKVLPLRIVGPWPPEPMEGIDFIRVPADPVARAKFFEARNALMKRDSECPLVKRRERRRSMMPAERAMDKMEFNAVYPRGPVNVRILDYSDGLVKTITASGRLHTKIIEAALAARANEFKKKRNG